MTPNDERIKLLSDIDTAREGGARLKPCCKIVGLTVRAIQRWRNDEEGDKRPTAERSSPKAMTEEEKNKIIKVCNSEEYKDKTPNEIVPMLAEKGIYIASESTFYKVLKERKLLKHRSNSKPPAKRNKPDELIADGPLQVLSWDITYLRTSVKGIFFYLYLFMDVWSRQIVGWVIEESESGDVAARVIKKICKENNITESNLHSDNGSPMKCGTMLATLQNLGVIPSFSRPCVSNDNPYSESLFKTLKYCPAYPGKFETVEEARTWMYKFATWYNTEHRHSGIKFVTPEQRYKGLDKKILMKRKETYMKAKEKNPQRWANNTRNWDYVKEVALNKEPEKAELKKIA